MSASSPHFSVEQLAQLRQIASTVRCECPRHLATLLCGLLDFEVYCQECERRYPEDAELHAFLRHATSGARDTMESALRRLLEAEGIQV